MNILVIGQGAMGLLWYHHISQLLESDYEYNNAQLHLLPSNRPNSDSSASNNPNTPSAHYSFTDKNNIEHHGIMSYAQVENIQIADVILLCVKSFQISTAIANISSTLEKRTSIIMAHNGLGTLTELPKNIIEKHNIYSLLTTHGCFRSAPLTITHTGIGITDIGLVSGDINLVQQQSLTQLLNAALPTVKYHKKVKQKQWIKLAINCVINPLTAIYDVNNGQIAESRYLQNKLTLLEEVVTVASVEGVELELEDLRKTVEKVAQATATNSSSMRCDVLANRKSEIDYINGYIHRLGIKHNIATPENTKMWQAIKNLESRF